VFVAGVRVVEVGTKARERRRTRSLRESRFVEIQPSVNLKLSVLKRNGVAANHSESVVDPGFLKGGCEKRVPSPSNFPLTLLSSLLHWLNSAEILGSSFPLSFPLPLSSS